MDGVLIPDNGIAILEDPICVSRLLSMLAQMPTTLASSDRYVNIMDYVRRLFEAVACGRCHASLVNTCLVDNVSKVADVLKIHALSFVCQILPCERKSHHTLSTDQPTRYFVRSFFLLMVALLNVWKLFQVRKYTDVVAMYRIDIEYMA